MSVCLLLCALSAPQRAVAPNPRWWSFQPIRQVAPPRVSGSAWCKSPIDRFILAGLEAKGMRPNPPADRRTLIRRLTFDLIGLPPTPEEIASFLADKSPKAYEKVVDRLLSSPRYGERWGRHWLDVVHYGDTHGYDKDKRRDHAWPYRDYVIRSFNEDKSYSRFIREQIAGDVLYPNDPAGIIATGFIAAGPWDFVGHVELAEGTIEKAKTRVLDRDDMVMNTISTFNSVTIHCARCHDHKFDPITQRDYYRLQAVFAGVERGERSYSELETAEKRSGLEKRLADYSSKLAKLEKQTASLTSPAVAELEARAKALNDSLAALPKVPGQTPSPTNGYHSEISARPDVEKWVQVDLGQQYVLDAIRLFPARPTDFPDTPGFGFPVRFKVEASAEPTFNSPITLEDHSASDYPNPGDNSISIDAHQLQAQYIRVIAKRLWPRTNDFVFALAELSVMSGGKNVARGAKVTAFDSIEAGRWSVKNLVDGFTSRESLPDLSDPMVAAQELKRQNIRTQLSDAAKELAAQRESLIDPTLRKAISDGRRETSELQSQIMSLPVPNLVYAAIAREPRTINVLKRGDVEQPAEEVGPGALSCIAALNADLDINSKSVHTDARMGKIQNPKSNEGSRRAALAEWIADPNNPLTWRSIVNRVWLYHFGKGIVDTPSDFGRNGSLPSHPELLDWLADYFQRSQSLKKLHKLIVMSAAYQQSSAGNASYAKLDSDNRLLWRMNRQRLDAEEVRDSILAVSGKLDLSMGGPGYDLFRFKDDHSPIYDHTAIDKINDPKTWRRTVYRFTVRSVPNPLLECLDCADPNINTPVRNTTLTALQALALLNDPFVIKQSELFALRVQIEASQSAESLISRAFVLALGRNPRINEGAALISYMNRNGLANTCRLLFNMNEFVFID